MPQEWQNRIPGVNSVPHCVQNNLAGGLLLISSVSLLMLIMISHLRLYWHNYPEQLVRYLKRSADTHE